MSQIDPRAASARVLDGPSDLLGEELIRLETVELDGRLIHVPAALPGAPEYRTVMQAERTADSILASIPDNLDHRGGGHPVADAKLALDFRDAAGTALASGAVGLESFANFHLERALGAEEQIILGDGRSLDLDGLRNLPLRERFADALPLVLDRPRPTSETWWSGLQRVNALAVMQRHALTHPHRRRGLQGETVLLQRLYNREYQGAAETMRSVFEHFIPGWIDAQRAQALAAS